jgi:hypothetical protein
VLQVLNQVTGQALGANPESWTRWYARAGRAPAGR